jgi:hypothetical protein
MVRRKGRDLAAGPHQTAPDRKSTLVSALAPAFIGAVVGSALALVGSFSNPKSSLGRNLRLSFCQLLGSQARPKWKMPSHAALVRFWLAIVLTGLGTGLSAAALTLILQTVQHHA